MMSHPLPHAPESLRPPSELHGEPGANPRLDLSLADWRFLLPRLRFHSILYLGVPPAPVARLLAGMADRVSVAAFDAPALAALAGDPGLADAGEVRLVGLGRSGRLPFPDRAFDLVVASGGPEASRFLRARSCLAELDRLLAPDGFVYFEAAGPLDARRLAERFDGAPGLDFDPPEYLWLLRRKGVIRLVVPLDDDGAARYCFDHVMSGVSRRGRALQRLGRVLLRMGALKYLVPRRVALLRRAGAGAPPRGPVPHVLAPARRAGLELEDGRTAFYARGDHNGNKVVFLLFGGGEEPEVVVKMPRSPAYNPRLEHEHACLTLLRESGAAAPGTYPEALFLEYHDGLAIHGQSMLGGDAFRNRTRCTDDCPYLHDALEWIRRLGEASVTRSAAATEEAVRRLRYQFERFRSLYPLDDREAAFLRRQIDSIAAAGGDLPLVFRHGDAGTWNIVVGLDGRVAFVDWEDADPRGLPLWDLLCFLQSYSVWVGRVRGEEDDAYSYIRLCLDTSPLRLLQVRTIERYCARVGLDRGLVEPLFHTCWMNRAVRSAAWRGLKLERATYFRLLRHGIARGSQGKLACLLA